MPSGHNGPVPDPITRRILAEMQAMHREMREMRVEMREDRQRSDDRFERMLREFRQDSARREAATQKAFRDVRAVGLAIVKTLNRHTRLLEDHGQLLRRIDRKLGVRDNGSPGNGRAA